MSIGATANKKLIKMKKFILCIFLLFLINCTKAQKFFEFHVKKSLNRMKNLDGTWEDWWEFNDSHGKYESDITIDLLSMTYTIQGFLNGVKQPAHDCKILGYDSDFQYQDLGFWVLYIKIGKEKGGTELYKISFNTTPYGIIYIQMSDSGNYQTKDYLGLK